MSEESIINIVRTWLKDTKNRNNRCEFKMTMVNPSWSARMRQQSRSESPCKASQDRVLGDSEALQKHPVDPVPSSVSVPVPVPVPSDKQRYCFDNNVMFHSK